MGNNIQENNSMKFNKKTNILKELVLIGVFFIGIGVFVLYRESFQEKNLIQITGKLTSVNLKKYKKIGGGAINNFYYIIVCKIEQQKTPYGIYAGTKKQATKKITKLNLVTGKTYSFYLNPTVLKGVNGINLGISQIKQNAKIIYKRHKKTNSIFGKIFIILGVIALLLTVILKQKNEKNHY